MNTLGLTVLVCLFAATSTLAEELPSELTVQCNGTMKTQQYFPVRRPALTFENDTFSLTLELREGTIYSVDDGSVLGTGCFLEKGIVGCSFKARKFLSNEGQTEVSSGIVMLNRRTGGLQMLHTTAYYQGSGRSAADINASEKVQRDGTCRSVSADPLF